MLLDLLEPTGGQIVYDGRSFAERNGGERIALRRRDAGSFSGPVLVVKRPHDGAGDSHRGDARASDWGERGRAGSRGPQTC